MGLSGSESALGYVREIFVFHQWRCGAVESALRTVEMPKWDEQVPGSFGSLIDLLNHLAWAEQVWLARIEEKPMPARLAERSDQIFSIWNTVTQRWADLLDGADDAFLARQFHFSNSKGNDYQMSTYEIVVHLMDHATYHIGQLMDKLRALGGTPVSTNYIHYLRAQQKQ